ncbi:MAG: ATP-binding protein [Pseudomonadota bacterium]
MAEREPRGDYNLRVLGALAHGVEQRFGELGLQRMATAAGLPLEELRAGRAWVSLAQLEAALQQAADLLGGDESAFLETCIQGMPQSYGALKYVLWATTPERVFNLAMSTAHLMTTISRWQRVEQGANRMRARYLSDQPESRWLCLVRQANIAGLPTLWGLPRPHFVEHSCMARGDACCEYEGWWPARRGWLWPLLAALVGGGLGLSLGVSGVAPWVLAPLLALLGGGGAGYLDLLRTQRQNQNVAQRSVEAVRQLAEDERRARLQVLELNARQRQFVHKLDGQVAQRTQALERTLERMQHMQQAQSELVQGRAHDLRNPLANIDGNAQLLIEIADQLPASYRDVGHEILDAARRLRQQADALTRSLLAQMQPEKLCLEPLVVPMLAQELRKRLTAMSVKPELAISVFSTREAPELIDVDTLRLDRVLDNLLTNALKYTERGSIIVELEGTPDSLVIKISDSGRGITEDEFAHVFRPGGSRVDTRAPSSHGLGLSVVVRLLAEMGGRLEVLSRPGKGTTFWIYLPREAPVQQEAEAAPRPIETDDALLARVVTIRRVASGD